jgi:hypothetical protein
MIIKHSPKRPMIWTGDLPARHFQAKPVDLSIEFHMEAVETLEDLEGLWKKFEVAFWKRFVPMMNKEIDTITAGVKKWDAEFPRWTVDQQKAAAAKLNTLTRAMGEKVKQEAQKYTREAFAEVMKGVDNSIAKAKVTAVVKVTWTIATAIEKVLLPSGWISAVINVLKMNQELQAAQTAFRADWTNLEARANAVQQDTLLVMQDMRSVKVVAADPKATKAAMDKLRATAKKLTDDIATMENYIAAARRSLVEQDKKIAEMGKLLAAGGNGQGADKAAATMADWRAARDRCVAELAIAAEAKNWAAIVQKQLAGAGIGDEGAVAVAAKKINGAAEKILKANDTVEKGSALVKVIEKIGDAVK